MNILHIATFVQGGAGRIIKDIAIYQKKSNDNVIVVTTTSEEEGYCNYTEYLDEFDKNNIKYYSVDSTFKRDIYLNLRATERVREILIKEDIDIIHAHAAIPAMVSIIARSGINKYIPIIQTMHGWGNNKTKDQELMDVTILNGLDKVITVSNSDNLLMRQKGISNNKLLTIYNGIKEKENFLLEDDITKEIYDYRKKGYKIVGCIGTVCERKNQELLVEALNVLDKDVKVFCIFIGEGEHITKLQDKAEKYNIEDRIKFYGYRKNAGQYIKKFDLLVLPSTSEGFGLVIVEGYREGVPVIASDIDVFKEIIIDRETGYLFENRDVKSLANILIEVLFNISEHELNMVTGNAYRYYDTKFRKEIMMKNYKKLYEDRNSKL